jgi:hypothetical protein
MVIHWPGFLVRRAQVFFVLRQIAPQDRQVRVSHQLLKIEDIHTTPQAVQGEGTVKVVQRGSRRSSEKRKAPVHNN